MSLAERAVKRAIDAVGAALGLLLLSPLLVVLGVAIRIDSPGPVFFRQERLGRGGRIFRIWKFRSMRRDAGVSVDERGNTVNSEDDVRHTSVGRVLRAFSLDELPQLLNVVAGDMSLIGPRPDLPPALALYTDVERAKLDVRPGMTGLAQVSGRNKLSAHEKWVIDAKYAREASLRLDLRILVATAAAVFGKHGVYMDRE